MPRIQKPVGRVAHTITSVLVFAGAFATCASAEDAKIKSASFSLQPVYQGDEIVVTSSDGKKWDTIDAKALKFSATMKVDTKHPGYVKQVGILLGGCHNTGCANNPVMYYAPTSTRDYNSNRVFSFPGSKIPTSKTGIAVPSYGDEILSACNNHLQADGATKSYTFNKLLTATFSANTGKHIGTLPPVEVYEDGSGNDVDYNGGDVSRQAQFKVRVHCKATPFKVTSSKLNIFVSPANPSQNGTCPAKGLLAVDIRTNREGNVKFKLFRNDGANQTVVAKSKKIGNDASGKSFRVYWTKKYDLKKSIDRKYMVVVIGHSFSTPWKSMSLKCGAKDDIGGPGGMTTGPRPGNNYPGNASNAAKKVYPANIGKLRPKRRIPKTVVKVAPSGRIVCLGGRVVKGRCVCPRRTKATVVGRNKQRCVRQVIKQRKGGRAAHRRVRREALSNQRRRLQGKR